MGFTRSRVFIFGTVVAALVAAGCGSSSKPSGAASDTQASNAHPTITLFTHDAFAVSKPVLASFTQQTGIKVKVLKGGDAGAELNQRTIELQAERGRRRQHAQIAKPGILR